MSIFSPSKKKSTLDKEKKRYSSEELKEFETIINKKIAKKKEELEELKASIQESSTSESGFSDDGSSLVEQKEHLNELFARQYKFINHLEGAMERIRLGNYGVCKVTGKLIAKSRLLVVPHTQHSVEAKNMRKGKKEG